MTKRARDAVKQDILLKIKDIAARDGKAPGRERFAALTGIKHHEWRGQIWRSWGDALAEAGFAPNELQAGYSDDVLLEPVLQIAKRLRRFPSTDDIRFEMRDSAGAPGAKTIFSRWRMSELAAALAEYASKIGESEIAEYAASYASERRKQEANFGTAEPIGYVYLQRHGSDYKIGHTTSLNKRGRQIQLELPQEIELVHSILTDDPVGVEAYWHRRFADKRTRGEWFRLTQADVAVFKRWSKIW